jgi:hypothetical protein
VHKCLESKSPILASIMVRLSALGFAFAATSVLVPGVLSQSIPACAQSCATEASTASGCDMYVGFLVRATSSAVVQNSIVSPVRIPPASALVKRLLPMPVNASVRHALPPTSRRLKLISDLCATVRSFVHIHIERYLKTPMTYRPYFKLCSTHW